MTENKDDEGAKDLNVYFAPEADVQIPLET